MLKKAFAVLLAFVLLATVFPVNVMAADDEPQEEPQFTEIRTVEELYKVNLNLAGNYRLMNDIDLTEATAQGGDWDFGGRGWEPIGSNGNYGKNNPFTGVFDGNGYKIKGMYINIISRYSKISDNLPKTITNINEIYLGLFSANSGTIKNLTVSGGIYGKGYLHYAGGIVGTNIGGIIENCVNDCDLLLDRASGYTHFWSGIAGTSSGGTISRCFNRGAVTIEAGGEPAGNGWYYASGITYGNNVGENPTITNCYNTGLIYAHTDYLYYSDHAHAYGISKYGIISNCYNIGSIGPGGLKNKYAISESGFITNCYYLDGRGEGTDGTKSLTPAQMKMQMMYNGFDFDNVWFIDSNCDYPYPQLRTNPVYQYELVGLELDDIQLDKGDVTGLTVKYIPDYTTDPKTVTWTSSDDSIASVDENGTVTAHKKGTATITVTSDNGVQASCVVTVLVPMTEITFEKSEVTIPRGARQNVNFTVLPSDTTDTYTVTSSDPEIATVDIIGNVTALKVGTAVITVKSSRGLEQSCVVTVNSPASSITVSESSKTLFAGRAFDLTAELSPKDTTDGITWTSSDESVAAVTPEGRVTAVAKGKAVITATADSGASAECEVTVESDIAATTIYLAYQETEYSGSEKTPEVNVYYNGEKLVENTDYSLSYVNNINAGKASVYITSLYDGTDIEKNFTINPVSVKVADISYKLFVTYTGSPLTALEEVTYQALRLAEGTDYEVSYENNVNAGTATLTVTGKGNYCDSAVKTFTVMPKSIASTTVSLETDSYRFDGSAKCPTVTVRDGEKVLTENVDYELNYSDNTHVGDAVVTVTGIGNYSGATNTGFKIYPKSISDAVFTLGNTVFACDGTEKCPEVRIEDNGVVLTEGVDYIVEYRNNKDAGTATVTVTGQNDYTGTLTAEFTIVQIGDVDRNGTVDIQDVTVLQRHLAEFVNADGSPIIDEADEEMLKIADVNRDGIVTIFDVTTIQRYLAEMIDL